MQDSSTKAHNHRRERDAAHSGSHADDHSSGHAHPHGHGHGHSHAPDLASATRGLKIRFYIGIALNLVFVGVEIFYGLLSNSMALLADAGHNLSDVLSLVLALAAVYLGEKAATHRFTYGFGRSSILISLANAVLILMAAGALAWETIARLGSSPEVPGLTIMFVAGIGVVINTASSLLYVKGAEHDLNVKGALLHLAADALVSLGVVAGGAVILYTGWTWVDPALSLLIVAVIVLGTARLLYDSLRMALDAAPAHVAMEDVRRYFEELSDVESFHDLHVWPLSTTSTALTVHLSLNRSPSPQEESALLQGIRCDLTRRFRIGHATIQLERESFECGGCSEPKG